jgi:CRP-like cAMP-binding protein
MQKRVHFYNPGDVVFREKDQGNEMFILLEGAVELTKKVSGAQQRLNVLRSRNDFFGEMALIDGRPRSATATAIEPTKLIVVNQAAFEYLIMNNGSFALKVIRVLTQRIRSSNLQISELAELMPQDRFVYGLVEYALAHGEPMYDKGVKVNLQEMKSWVNTHHGISAKEIDNHVFRLVKRNRVPFAPTSHESKECIVLSEDFIRRYNRTNQAQAGSDQAVGEHSSHQQP